jgi:hypothetical protein
MPSVKYLIELPDSERKLLDDIVTKGTAPARMILRANILLASDRNAKRKMTVAETAEVYHTTSTTVQNVRTEYFQNGLNETLKRKSGISLLLHQKLQAMLKHILSLCAAANLRKVIHGGR